MSTFTGDRAPVDLRPLTPEERRRAAIPARFVTRQQHRDFMRAYMRERRERARASHPSPPRQVTTGAPRVRRYDRPGFCGLCGHASPDPTCPMCVLELSGGHAFEASAAWGGMLADAIK